MMTAVALFAWCGAAVAGGETPYSFTYAGAEVLAPAVASERVVADTPRLRRTVGEWKSADGRLVLRSTHTAYKLFPVDEYLPELVAAGSEPTDIVADFRAVDFRRATEGPVTLNMLKGTVASPHDFEPVVKRLGLVNGTVRSFSMVATEGRSSAQWTPFWSLDFASGEGREFAIGWSGAWRADFSVETNGLLRMTAGMLKTHFRLLPGETIRQPSLLVFRREKGVSPREMETLVHRFMVDEKAPRNAKGEVIEPILACGAGGGNKKPELMLKIFDWIVDHKLPFGCYWVDAGWNGPAHMPDQLSNCGDRWYEFVGDWRFNPTVHPDGNLAKVAARVHEKGMKMLLWMEPERVVKTTPIVNEHRDWLLPKDKDPLDVLNYLYDFGNPEALDALIELVSKIIRENALDIFRQDFNFNTNPYWTGNDAEDRQGVTEAKHIAGLYRFWDTLRARFPHLLIENCASGGRRLDFEAISRSHSYCRTDFAIGHHVNADEQVIAVQNITRNMLAYQPFQGSETAPAAFFDDYGFFSSVASGAVFTPTDWEGGIFARDFTDDETAWFKRTFDAAERMRRFHLGDFYPQTPRNSVSRSEWSGYQMHRADWDAGFVVVFRRVNVAGRVFTCDLGGIDEKATYETEDYEGRRAVVSGAELRNLKLEIRDPRGYKLVFYRKVGDAAPEANGPVTFKSLLDEMADRDAVTRLPEPAYTIRSWSSYDRASKAPGTADWFANHDCSNFIRQEGREHVMVDAKGPGAVVRMWCAGVNIAKGLVRVYLDGSEKPLFAATTFDLMGGSAVCGAPFSFSCSGCAQVPERCGRNLILPIPYAKSCKITYEPAEKDNSFWYNVETRTYAADVPVTTLTAAELAACSNRLASVGSALLADPADAASPESFDGTIAPGRTLVRTGKGLRGAAIRRLAMRVKGEDALERVLVEFDFDGVRAIRMPLGAFFGTGPWATTPYRTRLSSVRDGGLLESRLVMPMRESYEMRIVNGTDAPVTVCDSALSVGGYDWQEGRSMHLTAEYVRRRGLLSRVGGCDFDMTFDDVKGRGLLVGTSVFVDNPSTMEGCPWWGEGDEKIWVDGEGFPSVFGTGTEDYFNYAWSRPEAFSQPFCAQPTGSGNLAPGKSVNLRWRALDALPFAKSLRFDMEMWHWDKHVAVGYDSVSWRYLLP